MGKPSSCFKTLRLMVAALLASVAVSAMRPAIAAPQFGANRGAVVGIEFDGRMVSDLDKSVAFYKAIGFSEVPGVNKSWRKDEVMNRIHGTKGVESRMAKFTLNSNISGKPFTLYLREFRGVKRRNVMSGKTAWEPGATHIDLTIPDAEKMWADLKAANMLWPRTWDNKLSRCPALRKARSPTSPIPTAWTSKSSSSVLRCPPRIRDRRSRPTFPASTISAS